MRFCVSGRQPYSIIKKADEVKFQYVDKDRILDLMEKYPDKTVILDVPGNEGDWKLWQMYSEKFADFYIALHDLSRIAEFNEAGIKWYWPYPITSYYELDMIVNCHPSYVMIGPPLSFDLDQIVNHLYDPTDSAIQIPLRMVVNVATPGYLPQNGTHGICGQWVRPEDCELYSTRINCFEFDEVDIKQEETLLHIYKDNKEWPGNLSLIIKRLNFHVDNRAIPEELGERRMTCGQRCWRTGTCQLCSRGFMFAEQVRKEKVRRRQEAAIDNN
jgi:hypothetical protein